MSLIVRHGARLEALADALFEDLQAHRPESAFALQTIIVAHPGMARWLRAALADRSAQGVAAGYEFLLPSEWLDRLSSADPDQLHDQPELLQWLLYDLLDKPPFSEPPHSEPGESSLARFRRAGVLAELFHRYSIYRPDWIEAFEQRGNSTSQALLWRALKRKLGARTRHARVRALGHALRAETELARDRLWVFSLSHCPPDLLDVFHRYGQCSELRWYFQNPCREYWLDLYKPRDLTQAQIAARASYAESGPPLLALLGSAGRDLFEALLAIADQDEEIDDARDNEAAVNRLQRLQQAINQNDSNPQWPADAEDRSLCIHACASEWAELEAVREALDRTLIEHPDLRPDQVLIMAVNPSAYRPWLQAVFSASAPAWPVRVADLNWLEHEPWFQLLELLLLEADAPIRRSVWMSVLRHPEVARHWHIELPLLDKLEHALDRVHASFGWSGADRGDGSEQHSLGAGLGRLWSHYASDAEIEAWTLVGLEASLLARAQSVLALLHEWRQIVQAEHSLQRWTQLLRQFLLRLLGPAEATFRGPREVLAKVLAQLEQEALLTECQSPLPLSALAECLRSRLRQPASEAPTPGGGIRFSGLVPFRSLPFRFIAVLGLSADQFPRQDPGLGPEDLLKQAPRQRLDRDRRIEDRYLLLEALLNAREMLHLSYVSKAAKDASEQAPSTLLRELAQALDAAEGQAARSLEKAPKRDWWRHGPALPFAPERFAQGSFAEHWLPAAQRLASAEIECPDWSAATLLADHKQAEPIALADWLAFVSHPGRWFVQRRLGMRFVEAREVDPDLEPLKLRSRGAHRLQRELLEASLDAGTLLEAPPSRWLELAELPAGQLGTMSFAALRELCAESWQQVSPEWLNAWATPSRVLAIDTGGVRGELQLRGDALFLTEHLLAPGKLLSAYLALQLAAATEGRAKQLFVLAEVRRKTKPNARTGFRLPSLLSIPVPAEPAHEIGEPFRSAYRAAATKPLLLPLEAAMAAWHYLEQTPAERMRAAEQVFLSDPYSGQNDPYWRLLLRAQSLFSDATLANAFLQQSLDWLAPLFAAMTPYGAKD